jgi:hypothetical protein
MSSGNPKPRGQWIGNLRAENGAEFVNDVAAHTGQFFALVVEKDAVLAAITQPHVINASGRVGIIYPQGYVIYGETTAFTLASGSVLAVYF